MPKRKRNKQVGGSNAYWVPSITFDKTTIKELSNICNKQGFVERVQGIAEMYKGEYEMERTAPTPGEIRAALTDLQDKLSGLSSFMASLDYSTAGLLDLVIQERYLNSKREIPLDHLHMKFQHLQPHLDELFSLSIAAERKIGDKNRIKKNAERFVLSQLIILLKEFDIPYTTYKTGAAWRCFEIFFQEAGNPTGDVRHWLKEGKKT